LSRADGEGLPSRSSRYSEDDHDSSDGSAEYVAEALEQLRGQRSSQGRGPVHATRDDIADIAFAASPLRTKVAKHFASSGRPGNFQRDRAGARLDRNLKTQKAAADLLLLDDTRQFAE
jgi:hypothetical protein